MSAVSKILRGETSLVVREVVDDQWQASEGHRNGPQIASPADLCSRKCLSWRHHGKVNCDSISLTAFSSVNTEEPQPGVTLPKREISLGLAGVTAPVTAVSREIGRCQRGMCG